jgi:hypothetical protein
MPLAKENNSASIQELQAGMERLERREWWRWAAALLIMLLLTLGVVSLSLSLPGLGKDGFNQEQLSLSVRGLFALVLVFDIFAIYQQVLISRLRRQMAAQIGMLATLEVLKPVSPEEQAGRKERRRFPRHIFDQRLKVTAKVCGKETTLYARVCDISESGLGAVISGSLERGDNVLLEFNTEAGDLRLTAVIRFVHGFRHGFEFAGMSAEQSQKLKQACLAAVATIAGRK